MRQDIKNINKLIASKSFNQAYDLLSTIDQDDLYIKGEYNLLIDLYTKLAQHINKEKLTGLNAKLGRVYYRKGQLDLAVQHLKIASAVDSEWQLFAMSVLCGLYAQTKSEKTLPLMHKTIELANSKHNEEIMAGTLVRLGMYLKEEKYIEEALAVAQKYVDGKGKYKWNSDIQRDIKIWTGYLGILLREKGEVEKGSHLIDSVMPYFREKSDKRYVEMFEKAITNKN